MRGWITHITTAGGAGAGGCGLGLVVIPPVEDVRQPVECSGVGKDKEDNNGKDNLVT